MDWLFSLKLLRLFDFYLALCFLAGTVLRVRQYQAVLNIVRAVPSRWPRLFVLVKQHRNLFLTWATVLPLVSTLVLWLAHTVFRRAVLGGTDDLTVARLLLVWPALAAVVLTGAPMLFVDLSGLFRVSPIDRPLIEKSLDQAEYWLRSWTAPVVRLFTLGFVNPRKMVHTEVRNALENVSQMINSSLWWMTMQTSLRLAFGAALWVSYFVLRA